MEFKKLSEEMLKSVAEVYCHAYKDNHETDATEAEAYLRKFFGFDAESCFVALDGDKPVGALFAYSYRRFGRDVLFLQELFVDPECRHKGVGRGLVSALRAGFGASARVNVVPLVKADTGVLNFYNSLGFEQDQTFSFFDD